MGAIYKKYSSFFILCSNFKYNIKKIKNKKNIFIYLNYNVYKNKL